MKTLTLASSAAATVAMEVDVTGWGVWVKAGAFALGAGEMKTVGLPRALSGYWVRFASDVDATLTAQFEYR